MVDLYFILFQKIYTKTLLLLFYFISYILFLFLLFFSNLIDHLLRSLRSYFVVKSLHFLKESKYFSLSFLYYETTKITEKIEKMYPWNWGVSIRHSTMKQFTDLSFEYVKSVCKIYVLLESNWRHCSVTMAFVLNCLMF